MTSGAGAKHRDDALKPAKSGPFTRSGQTVDDPSFPPADQDSATRWLAWLSQLLNDRAWFALYEFVADSDSAAEDAQRIVEKLASTKVWPLGTPLPDSLFAYAQRAVQSQTPLQLSPATEEGRDAIELSAIPLPTMNGLNRVLCVAGPLYKNVSSRTAMIRLCQWAATQLRQTTSVQGGQLPNGPANHTSSRIDDALAKVALDAAMNRSSKSSATALSNALLELCGCQRVSIGVGRYENTELLAISGQAALDSSRQLASVIASVMQHTQNHTSEIFYECSDDLASGDETSAFSTLLALNEGWPIASMRVESSPGFYLLIVLESPIDSPLLQEQLHAIHKTLKTHSNLLELGERADASFVQRIKQRYGAERARYKNLVTRKRQQWKLAAAAAALLLAIFPIPHKVSGTVSIEAADRQVIVAPQKGHVASAHARAGDLVKKGQLLATLDGRDLQLDVDKWNSEKAMNAQAYATALATHDRTELSRLRADAMRIDAELQQVEQNLTRSELKAPMDGVLLSGDLSQSLGAPVEPGAVLFEVGSTTRHRLIIKIDEVDVGYVKAEQIAAIRMASLPNDLWEASLEAVQPVAVAEAGSSYFRLPATIDDDIAELRPGMEGVARIKVGSRSSIWVLTHKPLQQLRYWLWRLGLSG